MNKIVIFGNSGSGKSTLAKQLSQSKGLSHLDLDTIAWQNASPPQRKSLEASKIEIETFLEDCQSWVIEGCYSDLLEMVIPYSSEIIFLNLPIFACIENAKNRPWEPHKYASKQEQDKNLNMLVEWIKAYETRNDTFSRAAHENIFTQYSGKKTMCKSNANSFSFTIVD